MKLAKLTTDYSDAWDRFTSHNPGFAKLRFEGAPGNYAPWKAPILLLGCAMLAHTEGVDDPCLHATAKLGCDLKSLDFPIYWIAKEYLEAISNTDIHEAIPLSFIKWPFQTMVVLLPRNTLCGPDGDFSCLVFGNCGSSDKTLIINAVCVDDIRRSLVKSYCVRESSVPATAEWGEVDRSFGDMVFNAALKIALAMTARPEMIEGHNPSFDPSPPRKKGIGSYRRPRWIGKSYINNGSKTPLSHGVQMHWRKGHYRGQRHGKELKLTRIIWIEPCLVGGDAA